MAKALAAILVHALAIGFVLGEEVCANGQCAEIEEEASLIQIPEKEQLKVRKAETVKPHTEPKPSGDGSNELKAYEPEGELPDEKELEVEEKEYLLNIGVSDKRVLELTGTGAKKLRECMAELKNAKETSDTGLNPSHSVLPGAYCPSSQRYYIGGSGTTMSLDACYIMSCNAMFYGNTCGPYFYTAANNDGKYAACKCCIPNSPTFYASSQGNNVFACR